MDIPHTPRPYPNVTPPISVIAVPEDEPPPNAWHALGFIDGKEPSVLTVPAGALIVSGLPDDEAFTRRLSRMPGPPALLICRDGVRYIAYYFSPDVTPISDVFVPPECRIHRPGEVLPFAAEISEGDLFTAMSLADLPELTFESGLVEKVLPPCTETSLSAFSLRGRASEFEAKVVIAEPLLGNVCFSGQATVWYAPPNAGKTLIGLSLLGDAVQARRIQPGNVFYLNADDSSAGFAMKLRLMDDLGVNTLAPGHRGFECSKLSEHLLRCVREGTATGVFIIIDTLKKFVDLMNKAQASAFADACRLFVMSGGTILAFAHTNKNPTATGKLTYTGTADILQDFDAAYIMAPVEDQGSKTERVIRFEAIKRRGGGTEQTAYRYAAEDDVSYEERLVSVAEVDPQWFEDFGLAEMERADAEVIEAIKTVIELGVVKKMQLAKTVATRLTISERRAVKVLETYTGEDPERHRWTFSIKDRGAKVYAVLPRLERCPMLADAPTA